MKPTFQLLVVLMAVFGLGLGSAFAGGAYYGRRDAPPAEPAAGGGTGTAPGASPAAGAEGGPRSAFGASSSGVAPTTGVVETFADGTATVRTPAGGTVTVTVQPDTRVSQLAPASPTEITPGQTVTVLGQPDADGAIAARSVQIGGTSGGGGPGSAGAGAANPTGSGPSSGAARPAATPGGNP